VLGTLLAGRTVGVGHVDTQLDGLVEEALHKRVSQVPRGLACRGMEVRHQAVGGPVDREVAGVSHTKVESSKDDPPARTNPEARGRLRVEDLGPNAEELVPGAGG